MVTIVVTHGRGMEVSVMEELRRLLEPNSQISTLQEGKISFTSPLDVALNVTASLRTVERCFLQICSQTFSWDDGNWQQRLETAFSAIDWPSVLTAMNDIHHQPQTSDSLEVRPAKMSRTSFPCLCFVKLRPKKFIRHTALVKRLFTTHLTAQPFLEVWSQSHLPSGHGVFEFNVHISSSLCFVGLLLATSTGRSAVSDAGLRVSSCSALLQSLNMSLEPRSGRLALLDGMCGSGSVLFEALQQNRTCYALAMDISPEQLERARRNWEQLPETLRSVAPVDFMLWNMNKAPPFRQAMCDAVVSDLPFGMKYLPGQDQALSDTLYELWMSNMIGVVNHNSGGAFAFLCARRLLSRTMDILRNHCRVVASSISCQNLSLGNTEASVVAGVVSKCK